MGKGRIKAKLEPEGLYLVNVINDVSAAQSEIDRIENIVDVLNERIRELQGYIELCTISEPDTDPEPEENDGDPVFESDPIEEENDGDPVFEEEDPEPPEEEPPEPDPSTNVTGLVRGVV